jgi:hypothetical protein
LYKNSAGLPLHGMEIQGKLIGFLPEVQGTSAKGPWKKQEIILETVESFPKKVCISFWGEKADEIKSYKDGSNLKVSINLESREYNGRWYTEVRAWKVEGETAGASKPQGNFNNTVDPMPSDPVDLSPSNDGVDDLPF